jgi:hypothetical protein
MACPEQKVWAVAAARLVGRKVQDIERKAAKNSGPPRIVLGCPTRRFGIEVARLRRRRGVCRDGNPKIHDRGVEEGDDLVIAGTRPAPHQRLTETVMLSTFGR